MRFYEPIYFWGLLLIPILGIFAWWAISRKKKALTRFGNIDLIMRAASGISFSRQAVKIAVILIAVFLLTIAAARPQLGTHMETVKREGLDIMIAVDVSHSMDAGDVQPGPISRLTKAKLEISSLLDADKLQGSRVGLVAFAGAAYIHCPLTVDYSAVKIFLDALDINFVPTPGTAIGEAILVTARGFVQEESKHKVLILLTDGEDFGSSPTDAAKAAADQGIRIYPIGIGTPGGEPIPIFNRRGEQIGFKKDENGDPITTKLDEETLAEIADITGGKYFRATPSELELDKIYNEISGMEKKELEGKMLLQYDDRYQWPLALALVFVVWEFFIPERVRRKNGNGNND